MGLLPCPPPGIFLGAQRKVHVLVFRQLHKAACEKLSDHLRQGDTERNQMFQESREGKITVKLREHQAVAGRSLKQEHEFGWPMDLDLKLSSATCKSCDSGQGV